VSVYVNIAAVCVTVDCCIIQGVLHCVRCTGLYDVSGFHTNVFV
jgi:hypothetical protein